MDVIKIIVFQMPNGDDVVALRTNLPSPTPNISSWAMSAQFVAERGTGVGYAEKHFPGIPIELVG